MPNGMPHLAGQLTGDEGVALGKRMPSIRIAVRYTLPRSTPNSRVNDLVDLLLLIRTGEVRQAQLAEAVRMTFDRKKRHAIPSALVRPPETWERQFRTLANECGRHPGRKIAFENSRPPSLKS